MKTQVYSTGADLNNYLYQLFYRNLNLEDYWESKCVNYFNLNQSETNSEYIYTADLVGLDKSKLSFKIEGLKATLEYNNPDDKRRSKFIYSFTLPEIADIDKVTTSYENGELKIVVGKLNRKIKEYTF